MEMPKVSVVMSVYNGQPWLSQAVNSILDQSLRALEFVVVDDGSVDGSWETLESFASQDKRLVLLRNERNLGFARAQNRAIATARSEFIACQDQDDVSLPDRLQRQVDYLEGNPEVGVVAVWPQFMNEHGDFIEPGSFRYESDSQRLSTLLLVSYCICGPSIMVRRNWLMGADPYDPDMRAAEDYDLLPRLSEKTRVANLPDRLYLYRQHADSVSHRYRPIQMHNNTAAREAALQRRFGAYPPEDLHVLVSRGYFRAALVAYGLHRSEEARRSLCGALRLEPRVSVQSSQAGEELLRYLVNFPCSDRYAFLESVFADLLPRNGAMNREKSRILGMLHMGEVFDGIRDGRPEALDRHWLAGVKSDPRWLLNRGVWAVGLRHGVSRLTGRKN
ncbi:MAG: glycosyltransferase [Thermoleophilia bacterium]|nr:glycosyltransferase [Thermoleophilia bacterium]